MPSVKLNPAAEPHTPHPQQVANPVREQLRALETAAAPLYSLKRSGQRPYAFNGNIVATVCGVTPLLPFWYEINVYRSVIDSYVAEIKLYHKGVDAADVHRVSEHDDLDGAFAWLERYDASADLAPVRASDPTASHAELALAAIRLQIEVSQIKAHYGSVVGDLIHTLDGR